jgi:hypothetical protein
MSKTKKPAPPAAEAAHATRPADGEGEAAKSDDTPATLEDSFKLHASKGSGSEATSFDISKWCKDAGLVGKTCDSGHIDISFTKAKSVKTSKLVQLC